MQILKIGENYSEIIDKTTQTILSGGLVIFPSDTVYILAVDPTNEKAVEKLLEFKNRPTGKPISVAVLNKEMAEEYVELSENGQVIYSNLFPGPFTIVSQGKHKVEKGIESEVGTLGVRIPDNKWIHDLVEKLKKPVTATSANLAGENPHYSIESFLNSLSEKKKQMIDLIIDAGKLPNNKPSTVIDATESELKILRRGDLITGDSKSLISKSEEETEKIAEFLLGKILIPSANRHQDLQYKTPLSRNGGTSPLDEGEKINRPIVLALSGDLGCGKTVFSRRVGEILGVKEKITSPTFFIYNEYKIQNPPLKTPLLINQDLPLIKGKNNSISPNPFLTLHFGGQARGEQKINKFLHFDIYRIANAYELEEIKFLDLFENNSLSCIEWPENMGKEYMEKLKEKTNYFGILFEYVDEETRKISFEENL